MIGAGRNQRRPGRRVLHVVAVVLRVFSLVSAAILVLALFSLELAPVRRFVVGRVNDALRSSFAGRITIEKIDHLGLTAVRGARVRVDDPEGTRVLLVDGASVRVSAVSTLRSALLGKGDIVIDLSDVKIGYVDANLDVDATGDLRLVKAFAPKDETPTAPAARKTAIQLRHVGMDHAWLHGRPPGAPLVDADIDRLAASALVGSTQKVELAGMQITTRALPQNANLHWTITASFDAPAQSGNERAAHVDVHGDVGGIPLTARASLDGTAFDAVLDVPRATPDMIAALVPSITPTQDLSVHAEAHGLLGQIEVSVHAAAGPGTVDIRAGIAGEDEKVVRATFAARTIDAYALSSTAPSSNLGLDAEVDAKVRTNGDVAGTYGVDVLEGTVGATAVPSAHLGGSLRITARQGEPRSMSLDGSASVDEPGVRARLDFEARRAGDVSTAGFDVAATVPQFEKTRMGSGLRGSAEFRAHGTATIGAATAIDVDADLTASNVAQDDRQIQRAWLRAHVRGPSNDPQIDAIFQGSELAAAGMRFTTAAVTAHGSLRGADVTFGLEPRDAPRIGGRASIETGPATVVRNASIDVSRDDQRAVIGVRTLRVGQGELRVDGLTIEGLGDPVRAEARLTDRGLVVKASTNELDLSRLAKLLRSSEIHDGHLSFDVDLDVRRSAARGHVRAALVQGEFARAKKANGNLDVTIDARSIDGVAHADVGDVGKIDVDRLHLEVDGDEPLSLASLKKARGALSFGSEVDLARIRGLLPRGSVPLTDLAGKLRFKGEATRGAGIDAVPDIRMSAETRGLLLSGRGDSEQVDGARVLGYRPWSLEGVDVEFAASVAHETGATQIEARLSDAKGLLTSLDIRSPEVPYRDWVRGKGLSLERLGALPVAARLVVPRRDLKTLPALLKTQQFSGDVALDFAADGRLADPDVRLSLETAKFASTVGARTKPLDAKVTGRYARGEGKIDLEVSSAERQLLAGEVTIAARITDFFEPQSAERPAWHASTRMHLTDFPLETSGLFSDLRLRGFVSGQLAVDDLHENASAKVDLAFRDLRLGRARFPRGMARAELDAGALRAAMRLDQTDGFVETNAQLGMTWGSDTAPTPTTDLPAFVTLKASGFHASAILPFVSSAVSNLDGRIDADARIDVKQGGGPPNMKGTVTLRDGTVQLARVGEPLHDVSMKVVVTPDGLVRLEDLTAHGSSGTLSAKAIARLNGFNLVGARANLRIPRRDPLPVDFDGQDIGSVDGDMAVSVDRSPDGRSTKVAVDIARLHTDLPLSSSHKAQELGEAKGVRIGYFRRQRQFVLLPMNAGDLAEQDETAASESPPSRTEIAIHLGKDVEIKRGTTLKVELEGDPKIEITDQARMSGQIRLTRGILEVQGKRFEIERGTVTFVGDEPGNPQVMVTAGWTAPDGTRVYADFVGPLKTGKVKLRSEPARSQDEVLALIMFGTAEGSSSTPFAQQQPSGATRAGTTAGGFATEGLSKGLDELTGLEVSTKIDTTNSANPKPEIEVQIARDISLQLGYVIGTPPPGTNPDKTLITLDWRFERNWSMEATFGDQGSSIMDFVWQYRY